ncbi:hatching enzyme-like [Asterias rubens]|uniref:hatching enzyme-like n=1 Tax=Asterias rubens TaxID=7604 RepID=UPI0014557A0E|nr:hatching enzyme-like [Asterias rubens]
MSFSRHWFAMCVLVLSIVGGSWTLDDGRANELDEDPQMIRLKSYLERNGYMTQSVLGTPEDYDAQQNLAEAIADLQNMLGLDPTGEVDEMLMAAIDMPRCGMPDNVPEDYRVSSVKYGSPELTYRIDSFTPDMAQEDVRMILRSALQVWSDVSQLTFTEVFGLARADIAISFAAGQHGDVASFDGPGGVLAHAFLPRNSNTHFDEDERWTMGTPAGINLFQVAAHEFGHALGLYHSTDLSALMYPYYRGYQANFQLGEDDIEGIQSLYGAKQTPGGGGNGGGDGGNGVTTQGTLTTQGALTTSGAVTSQAAVTTKAAMTTQGAVTTQTPQTPTSQPPPPSGACRRNGTFDAVVNTKDGRTFGFIGAFVWRLDVYPRTYSRIRATWPSLPNNIKSAITEGNTTYIIKGCYAWQYEDQVYMGRVHVRSKWPALPCNVNAGYVSLDSYTYFYKGQFVYRYRDNSFMFRRRIRSLNYGGLPSRNFRVTAINPNLNEDGQVVSAFVFSGNIYYLFDDAEKRFVYPDDYPRHVANYILPACGNL